MKSKKIWLAVVICIIGMLLGGCGMEENVQINSNLSSKINDKIYVTKWEEAEIEKELVNMGYGSFEAAMKTMGYKYEGKVKRNGVEHNMYQSSRKFSAKDTKSLFVVLNKKQAVMDVAGVTKALEDELGELGGASLGSMADLSFQIKYPFQVYKTNGKLLKDKYTVQYSLKTLHGAERIYAVSSKKYADNKKCVFSGVKNKAYYCKNKKVKVESEGVITSFKVNQEVQPENVYTAKKEGTYSLKVKLLSGSSKTLKFTIDKTKPTVSVKARDYKGKVTIKFQDKLSGVKKATLNGKSIKNGKSVSKKGSYVLKVTDKAGNVKTVKFSIK